MTDNYYFDPLGKLRHVSDGSLATDEEAVDYIWGLDEGEKSGV